MTSPTPEVEGPGAESPPVTPGQVVAGKFRVERVIGEGGMGIVVEATHLLLDERVALKFLRREVMRMPEVVARFDAEARASVKLKSEHVARVSDVGRTEDGIPFMVMELLDGTDLGRAVAERGPLPVSEAVEYIIQACEGVGEAHARGIVHRDLKPENLFLVKRGDWGVVKVLDFGISKAVLVGPSNVNLATNSTTSIMGSPYYMSPEQLRSTKSVDHRADIWSLGVVLFELLTGGTIFDETKEFTELVADILESPHRSLTRFRKDAPAGLEIVVNRCLEKDRTRRYQNVAELAVALLPFAPRRSRVTVERTTSITRAAGLITDPNFQLPPSNYPPAMHVSSNAAVGVPSSNPSVDTTLPPLPPLPSFSRSPVAISDSPSAPGLAAPSSPSLPANNETFAPSVAPSDDKKTSKGPVLIGLLLFCAGIAVAFIFFRGTSTPPPSNAQGSPQPSTSAPLVVASDSLPQPSASTTAAATTAAATAGTAKAVGNSAGGRRPVGAGAVVPVKPSAAPSAPATHQSLDIQMER